MEKLVANLALNKVQKKELAGKRYIVAPVSMIVEGVFAGSQGPLFYAGEEIAKSVGVWNHKPLTVGHPQMGGQYVSACLPESIDQYSVGMILNTKWNASRKKLLAEAWFEETRLDTVPGGNRIKEALTKQEPMEVSTGLFVDNELSAGQHQGREYRGRAKNFRPDHLAMIVSGVGACSLKDGAGLLVNKQNEEKPSGYPVKTMQVAIAVANESRRIVEIDEELSLVVYNEGGKLFAENFTFEDSKVKLLGNRIQVVREVKPLIVNEKVQMKREEIAAILGDAHKDFVANLSDDQVTALGKLQIVQTVEKVVEKIVEKPVVNESPKNLDELLACAPADVKAKIDEAFAVNTAHRDGLIEKIVANAKNQFSKEELQAMSTASLDKLTALAVNTASGKAPVFAGSAAGATGKQEAQVKGFLPPSTFAKV
jgi:hypothetical protein